MIHWICGVSLLQKIPHSVLRSWLGLHNLSDTLRWHRLRFYGHLVRHPNEWPSSVLLFEVNAPYPRGRPRKRWVELIKEDMHLLNITEELAVDRPSWRRLIHPTMLHQNLLQPSDGEENGG